MSPPIGCRRSWNRSRGRCGRAVQFLFVDGLRESSSTAVDHTLAGETEEIATRKLNDGRAYQIVKSFHDLDHLSDLCRRAGLDLAMQTTPTYFYYGIGIRAAAS